MLTWLFRKNVPTVSRYLLCIDYDDTLVPCNSYLILEQMGVFPGQATPDDVNRLIKIHGLKNPEHMCEIIRRTLDTGNCVAIVSFTRYLEIIEPTLLSIGLTEHEVKQIYIKSSFPSDSHWLTSGKQEHIQAAKVHFNINENERVLLVDDSPNNVAIAEQNGHKTVLVPKSVTHDGSMHESEVLTTPGYISNIYAMIDELSLHEKPFSSFDPSPNYLPSFTMSLKAFNSPNMPTR